MKTVKIANKDAASGFTIINEDDFDPKVHTLHGAEKPAPKAPAKKTAAKKA